MYYRFPVSPLGKWPLFLKLLQIQGSECLSMRCTFKIPYIRVTFIFSWSVFLSLSLCITFSLLLEHNLTMEPYSALSSLVACWNLQVSTTMLI